MRDTEFHGVDLERAQAFLSQRYSKMSITSERTHPAIRMRRRCLGAVSFDELRFDSEVRYEAAPIDRVVLTRVRTGYFELSRAGGESRILMPDDDYAAILTTDDLNVGKLRGRYETITFSTAELAKVTTSGTSKREGMVQLTSGRPVSAAAARQLTSYIDYLRDHVLSRPEARDSPAIARSAVSMLAACVLNTFPNNVLTSVSGVEGSEDVKSHLLRRAIAFVEEHAHTGIGLSDIAGAIHVTPRALQIMFRRHLNCTPSVYLRRVRLQHVHEELVAADPDVVSVAMVAARWGFAHGGRFAAYYRERYGQDPRLTLRG